MKSFIVAFKVDFEPNSVSQNSPFFTPRCKIQVWATIDHGERPPCWSSSQNPSAFLVRSLSLNVLCSSTSDLQGLLSTSPHGAAQQAVENCKLPWQQAQRTSPHCSNTRSCQSMDLRNTKQISTELLSLQRKPISSSDDFHQTLHSKNSIVQH